MKTLNAPGIPSIRAEKCSAARNALMAKYTLETLGEEQKRKVDGQIIDLLIVFGLSPSRAKKYRSQLRETQYYGMAALAMAFLGIPPALPGVLFREQWEHVPNPLVALTNAEAEIENTSNEILRKHRVLIVISDKGCSAIWRITALLSMPFLFTARALLLAMSMNIFLIYLQR